MKGFVYIIYSEKWDQYYVGSSQDIEKRLLQHNSGKNKSTRGGSPWVLKYSETFDTPTQAKKREFLIKKKKSRKYIEWLINSESSQ